MKSKKSKKTKKKLSTVRMISKKKYKQLLSKKKLSTQEKQQLNHALFINYCKCIKKLKYWKLNCNKVKNNNHFNYITYKT